ncbi:MULTISPECIES: hypothetical protein [Undibacterium]|uniref:Membrane protein n=1 Tax=Undibacterium squillarum TaxID=1131567 RepID=A0ABQ2XR56_9BURK|nr:hypothetical protein [Undibacterium squillarum]GGX30101.1 membrane protein [Undibacterium squillarum]
METRKSGRFFFGPAMMIVLWPAFLMACAATGLVFSLVDPMELIIFDERLQMHITGVYTIGFFAFWLLGILSSGLTVLLVQKAR